MDESTADLTLAEKIEKATAAKAAGNDAFKSGDNVAALSEYSTGAAYLRETFGAEGAEAEAVKELRISCMYTCTFPLQASAFYKV